MLRSSFLVFIAGWVLWFWIDKPPAGVARLPRPDDSMVENFQRAFDMLKAGHLDIAWLYIWNAPYLVLSLLGGALLSVMLGVISDRLARRRMRNHFLPPQQDVQEKDAEISPPGSVNLPVEQELPGDRKIE